MENKGHVKQGSRLSEILSRKKETIDSVNVIDINKNIKFNTIDGNEITYEELRKKVELLLVKRLNQLDELPKTNNELFDIYIEALSKVSSDASKKLLQYSGNIRPLLFKQIINDIRTRAMRIELESVNIRNNTIYPENILLSQGIGKIIYEYSKSDDKDTITDYISKGILLLSIAKKAKDQGLKLVLIDQHGNMITEIGGL